MSEFKRKDLREIFQNAEIDVPKDVLTQIIELHSESIEGFKASNDELNEKIKTLENQMSETGETVSKEEYDSLQSEFDKYKQAEINNAKSTAYRDMLKAVGISEKHIESILKVSDLSTIELDENGKIKDVETLSEQVKTDYGDFVEHVETIGPDTPQPPKEENKPVDLGTLSMAEYIKYRKDNK